MDDLGVPLFSETPICKLPKEKYSCSHMDSMWPTLSNLSGSFGVMVLVEVSLPLLVFSHTAAQKKQPSVFCFLNNKVAQGCLLYNWVYFLTFGDDGGVFWAIL